MPSAQYKPKEDINPSLSDPGSKPVFRWIPIESLVVDAKYQRPTTSTASRKNLEQMRLNFSWSSCGAIIVCVQGTSQKYAVIDGQHRVEAARQRGDIESMPCIIVDHAGVQGQAKNFVSINKNRVKLSNLQSFPAAIASGDEMAIQLKQILDEAKISIPQHPSPKGETQPRETCALGTLFRLMDDYTRQQIIWVLTIIPEAYGAEKGQMRASLIKALALLIKKDAKLDRVRMMAVLREHDPAELNVTGAAIVKAQGGQVSSHIADILMREYTTLTKRSNKISSQP